eukprot:TRINITY_DN390_c0_g1_i1.p1 TRINITY_DN390_c0_g1~~TRINITY_DN390_c0_g1_i1.p1  ORF type:complete len:426 (+),score=151.68 TRINITY_DN390_c0_g1_i1:186-1463(+)
MNPQMIRGFQGVNARRGLHSRTVATNVLKGTTKPKSPPTIVSHSSSSSTSPSMGIASSLSPSIPAYPTSYATPTNNYYVVPYVGLFNRDYIQFYPAYPVYQPAPIPYSTPYYNNYSSTSLSSSSYAPLNRRDFNYSIKSNESFENGEQPEVDLRAEMGFVELRDGIMKSFQTKGTCKLSWFHRMLTKAESEADYERSISVWKEYINHNVDLSAETGTLIIKAACKAGVPERGLGMLKQMKGTPSFPSAAGIQYLMINLSLKKNTEAVMNLYEFIKAENLKITPKIFHILIRDCVDNDLVKEAFLFAKEAKELGIEINRVCYNILMNGCRKHNMADEIIQLRTEMEKNQIEMNDTTVKFTSLAYMMLGKLDQATESFLEYKSLKNVTLEEFAKKFLDPSESEVYRQHATDLFAALKSKGVEVSLAL